MVNFNYIINQKLRIAFIIIYIYILTYKASGQSHERIFLNVVCIYILAEFNYNGI